MTMTPRERVQAALNHVQPDFTPCDYYATPEIHEALLKHFGLGPPRSIAGTMGGSASLLEDGGVAERLGVDLRYVNAPYIGPPVATYPDGSSTNLWGIRRRPMPNEYGEYAEPVGAPYAAWTTVEEVEKFPWPNPDWFDYLAMPAICAKYPDLALICGGTHVGDFINGVAFGRGIEQVFIDIASNDPVYLGIGPAEYYTGDWPPPPSPADPAPGSPYSDEQFAWMVSNGVTHVLSFAEIDPLRHPVAMVWIGFDELLSRAWGRFQEPIFLYELSGALPRARFEPPDVAAKAEITELRANRVSVRVESPIAGKVVLGDLDYPGWLCQVDGLTLGREDGRVMASQRHGMDRAVDVPAGTHEIVWVYQPRSLYYGLVVSLLAATQLLLACVVRVLLARRRLAAASSDAATTITPKR